MPYTVIKFLTGQINYGGRVTDDWDRRTLMTILDGFITPQAMDDAYTFSPSGPPHSPLESVIPENLSGFHWGYCQDPALAHPSSWEVVGYWMT